MGLLDLSTTPVVLYEADVDPVPSVNVSVVLVCAEALIESGLVESFW